jgi:DNA-binding MarR family transcriptional regulator/N-acetylglutamate synthase-like GNAT family acetyltransferase
MAAAVLDRHIDEVRRFNRFYTRRIGALQDGFLRSPFSLAEVRVLYELAHLERSSTTATELARALDMDPGYLSRVLNGFAKRGLIDRSRSERDGRESVLSLSTAGHAAFQPLEHLQRGEVARLLGHLAAPDQQRLVRALQRVERLLGAPEDRQSDQYTVRAHQPGDMGWVVERHGALYAEEYGFDAPFEALVARIVAKFLEHLDGERERCWIAERSDGERVGCVFLVKASKRVAKLRLFLVEPDARGVGLGKRLVADCVGFARSAGYARVRLWTQSNLLAARHVYESAGFVKIEAEPHHSFGQDLVAETWQLNL